MKKIVLFSFCFCSFLSINSQNLPSVENGLFSVNILTPGLEYEIGLTNSSTLDFRAGTSMFVFNLGVFGKGFGVYPTFNVQYRYYYNLEKRYNKGKNIANNSANYFALSGGIQSGNPIIGNLELHESYFGVIGPVWGLQRYYGTGFKLDLNLGGGYGFKESGSSYFSPIVGLRLGWRIFN